MAWGFKTARTRRGLLALGLGSIFVAPVAQAQFFFQPAEVPPGAVARGLQDRGYTLMAPLMRHNEVYLADVEAGRGRHERWIIDARTGQVVQRFAAPAPGWRDASRYDLQPRLGADAPLRPPGMIQTPLGAEPLNAPAEQPLRRPKRDVAKTEDAAPPAVIYGNQGASEPAKEPWQRPRAKPAAAKPKPSPPPVAVEPRPTAPAAAKAAEPETKPATLEAQPNAAQPAPSPTPAAASAPAAAPLDAQTKPPAEAAPPPSAAKPTEPAPQPEPKAAEATPAPQAPSVVAPAAQTEPKPVAAAEPQAKPQPAPAAKSASPQPKPQAAGKPGKINDIPVSPLE